MNRFSTRLATGLIQDRHREAAEWLRAAEATRPSDDPVSTREGTSFHRTLVGRSVFAVAGLAASIRQPR